jgi:hypothetical protein
MEIVEQILEAAPDLNLPSSSGKWPPAATCPAIRRRRTQHRPGSLDDSTFPTNTEHEEVKCRSPPEFEGIDNLIAIGGSGGVAPTIDKR